MFERWPLLGLILTLNLCVLIWQISVQQVPSSMLESTHDELQRPTVAAVSADQINNSTASLETTAILQTSITSIAAATTPSRQLPASDFAHLIDLHDFEYLMTQPSCNDQIEALIVVQSAPHNQEKRRFIRETWGGAVIQNTPLRLLFMLGAVPLEPEFQLQLQKENARHDDMVQGNFIDAYRNMTYKHVMAFKWFLYNCKHAQLLIKVDDDMYVNTPLLLKYIRNAATQNVTSSSSDSSATKNFNASQKLFRHPQNLLFCNPSFNAKVQRSFRGKWRTSLREYSGSVYPPYCPGFVIIYSADVVLRLYNAAQHRAYFWIDDVLITGILAQSTNTSITTLQPYLLRVNVYERLLAGNANPSEEEFLFSSHLIKSQLFSSLWALQLKMLHETTQVPAMNATPPISSAVYSNATAYANGQHRRRR